MEKKIEYGIIKRKHSIHLAPCIISIEKDRNFIKREIIENVCHRLRQGPFWGKIGR